MRATRLAAGLAALMWSTGARAQAAPDDTDARYARILATFEATEGREALWWNGWTVVYGAATAGHATAAFVATDPGLRVDATVGAMKSSLGLLSVLALTPRTPIHAAATLRSMDASTTRARARRLATAEGLLRSSAEAAALGTSWLAHVGGAVLNVAGAWVQWAGYHRAAGGWLGLVVGFSVGEATILTRPTDSIRAWSAYSLANPDATQPATPIRTPASWTISPTVNGLHLTATF